MNMSDFLYVSVETHSHTKTQKKGVYFPVPVIENVNLFERKKLWNKLKYANIYSYYMDVCINF